MPSQRPFALASQNGSAGGPASHWPLELESANGSCSANRPGAGNPVGQADANCGAKRALAASPVGVCDNGGVVTRTPAPARNPAPYAAGAAAPSITAAQAISVAIQRPPTARDRSARPRGTAPFAPPLWNTPRPLGGMGQVY